MHVGEFIVETEGSRGVFLGFLNGKPLNMSKGLIAYISDVCGWIWMKLSGEYRGKMENKTKGRLNVEINFFMG